MKYWVMKYTNEGWLKVGQWTVYNDAHSFVNEKINNSELYNIVRVEDVVYK